MPTNLDRALYTRQERVLRDGEWVTETHYEPYKVLDYQARKPKFYEVSFPEHETSVVVKGNGFRRYIALDLHIYQSQAEMSLDILRARLADEADRAAEVAFDSFLFLYARCLILLLIGRICELAERILRWTRETFPVPRTLSAGGKSAHFIPLN